MEGKMNNGSDQKVILSLGFDMGGLWPSLGREWRRGQWRGKRDKRRQSGGGGSSGEKEGWLGRGSRAEWGEAGAQVGTPF